MYKVIGLICFAAILLVCIIAKAGPSYCDTTCDGQGNCETICWDFDNLGGTND